MCVRRVAQRAVRSSSAPAAASMVSETWTERSGRNPRTGRTEGMATSEDRRPTVPRPQAYSRAGRAAASRSPAPTPTLVSRAEQTTAGRSSLSARTRARRTPPSGAALSTTTSAASSRLTARGSADRCTDSSAAMGTSMRRRRTARSVTLAQGCSAYSRPPAARSMRGRVCRAVSRSQAPPRSMRTRPNGPRAERTALRRRRSALRDPGEEATLTSAVVAPDSETRACAW